MLSHISLLNVDLQLLPSILVEFHTCDTDDFNQS